MLTFLFNIDNLKKGKILFQKIKYNKKSRF